MDKNIGISNDDDNSKRLSNSKENFSNKEQDKRNNKNQLNFKINIINKLLKNLINHDNNIQLNEGNNLKLLKIIDILSLLDKSFSSYYFNNINKKNDSEFYFQQEYSIIKNIYNKIININNLNFNDSLEVIYNNIQKASKKQENAKNIKNNGYYYTYNILYDYIILILIFNNNEKELKKLSFADKIFLCDNHKEQKFICKIIQTYLNFDFDENIIKLPPEIKSVYYILSLFNKVSLLKKKIKNNENNNENTKEKECLTSKKEFNDYKLNEQNYCQIILKKDYIIKQLRTQIENVNWQKENENIENDNIIKDLEEEIEFYKKENEDLKKMYDLEFELMSSAVYGLGIHLFFNKEQQHNEKNINNSSWLTKQKKYLMESNK